MFGPSSNALSVAAHHGVWGARRQGVTRGPHRLSPRADPAKQARRRDLNVSTIRRAAVMKTSTRVRQAVKQARKPGPSPSKQSPEGFCAHRHGAIIDGLEAEVGDARDRASDVDALNTEGHLRSPAGEAVVAQRFAQQQRPVHVHIVFMSEGKSKGESRTGTIGSAGGQRDPTPNPKTAGGAKWADLAAGYAPEAQQQRSGRGQRLRDPPSTTNVLPVLDSGPRGSNDDVLSSAARATSLAGRTKTNLAVRDVGPR